MISRTRACCCKTTADAAVGGTRDQSIDEKRIVPPLRSASSNASPSTR